MNYWDEWYADNLGACTITNAYIGTSPNGIQVKDDISNSNGLINLGTEESLFKSMSQYTIQLEIYNGDYKYEGYEFKGKALSLDVRVYNDNDNYSTFQYRNFVIDSVERNNDYLTLSAVLNNKVARGKNAYSAITASQQYPTPSTIFAQVCTLLGLGSSIVGSFGNDNIPYPTNSNLDLQYLIDSYNAIDTNGALINQIAQVLGGFACIDKGTNSSTCKIKAFPKTILNREVNAYVYGGTYDMSDDGEWIDLEVTYPTGPTIEVSPQSRVLIQVDPQYVENLWVRSNTGEDLMLSDYFNGDQIEFNTLNDEGYQFSYAETGSGSFSIKYRVVKYHNTGDWLDGNTDTKDGGSFTDDFIVLDDSKIVDLIIDENYYQTTGVKANIANYVEDGGTWTGEDKEYTVGTTDSLVDITDNNFLKLPRGTHASLNFNDILSEILSQLSFPSVKFNATILNNLDFELGDVVAICSGVSPTKYSYVENTNTDISGSTIISNNRGEQ